MLDYIHVTADVFDTSTSPPLCTWCRKTYLPSLYAAISLLTTCSCKSWITRPSYRTNGSYAMRKGGDREGEREVGCKSNTYEDEQNDPPIKPLILGCAHRGIGNEVNQPQLTCTLLERILTSCYDQSYDIHVHTCTQFRVQDS